MSLHDDVLYLRHMDRAAETIRRRLKGVTRGQFDDDDLLQDGVIRQLEILGEAAGQLSSVFQANHPTLDIRNMKALRNVLIHNYANVDLDVVWDIATYDVPTLCEYLTALLHDQQKDVSREEEEYEPE